MQKIYHGACHCGAVQFDVDIDLSAGTGRCNCTFCSKSRYWGAIVKPDAFRLRTPETALKAYTFATHTSQHMFCKECGLHAFGKGYVEEIGGAYCSVNVACLVGLTPEELAALPIRYFDGLNNNWQFEPKETRYL
jgi:hypothetical protein